MPRSGLRRAAQLVVALLAVGWIPAAPAPAEAESGGLVRPGKRRGGGGLVRPGKRQGGGRQGGKGQPARPGGNRGGTQGKARSAVLIERYLGVLERRPAEQFAMTRLVELYRQEHGTLDGLIGRFEARVEDQPDAFEPRMILGELYNRAGRSEDALRLFRAASEARPGDPAPHRAAARIAEELGDGEAALEELGEALALSRGDDRQEVLRQLRELAVEQGDLEAARSHHESLVRGASSSLYVRLELGQALARAGRHAEAIEAFQQVMRHVRGDPRARVPVLREIARSQVALGQDDEALETLRGAIRQTAPGTGQRAELHELMVDVYRRRDDLRGLAELLEGERGGGFERAELLGRLFDELGEASRAEEHYRAALRTSARHVDTRLRLIRLLVRQGRIEEATTQYETLVRLAPREPRFMTELAEMYLRVGQRERALALLARVGRSNPQDVAIHSALLELYSHWGEEGLALEESRTLARIDPRDETHLVDLGERYFQAGDEERALATWRRIPQVVGERWRGLAALADVYADHERTNDAIELYEEALRLRPDEVSVLRRFAGLLERIRRWEDAVRRWQQVIEATPDTDTATRREARTRIVTIWANQRSLPGRLPELRRRFGAPTPDVEAGRFLYESLARLSRLSDAVTVMRRVIELRPGDVEAHLSLERALVRQGQLSEAMVVVRRLLELAPRRSRELFQRLASYAMQLGRDDEALEYAGRALALNPDDAQGHLRLAQLHRQQGNVARAVAAYGRALEINDRLFDAYLELAELHETRSEAAQAIRVYVRLLAKAPDDALVARASRQALLLAVMEGSVADLEDDLLPLALAHTERAVYRRALVDLYANLTWPLIQQAAYGDPAPARAAREQLRAIGQRSLQPLLDALLDVDPDQQAAAVSMLGHLGNPSAAVPLLAYATGSEGSPQVRARALVAAGRIGDERIVDDLVELLDSSSDEQARVGAAFGLGQVADARSAQVLSRHSSGAVAAIRALACVGMGRSGSGRHEALLVERLERDPDDIVRAAAAWALGRVGSEASVEPLARTLRSAPLAVRRAAVWALAAGGHAEALRDLAWALFDQDPQVRQLAAWGLRRAGDGRAEPLDEGVFHRLPGGQLRVTAFVGDLVRVPARGGGAAAAFSRARRQIETALEDALGGRGRPRTERVTVALRALEAPEPGLLVLSPLVDRAELTDPEVEAGMRAVAGLVVRRCADLLAHRSSQIRGLAVSALGSVGGPEGARALGGALDDEDEAIRDLALDLLGRLGEPTAVEAVAALLVSADEGARIRAARTLGLLGGDLALQRLLVAAREGRGAPTRIAAIRSLGPHQEASAEVVAGISRAAEDEDLLVRRAACSVLGRPAAAAAGCPVDRR